MQSSTDRGLLRGVGRISGTVDEDMVPGIARMKVHPGLRCLLHGII